MNTSKVIIHRLHPQPTEPRRHSRWLYFTAALAAATWAALSPMLIL